MYFVENLPTRRKARPEILDLELVSVFKGASRNLKLPFSLTPRNLKTIFTCTENTDLIL